MKRLGQREKWQSPRLLVLVRSRAGENCLVHCKSNGPNISGGPGFALVQDCADDPGGGNCRSCQARAAGS